MPSTKRRLFILPTILLFFLSGCIDTNDVLTQRLEEKSAGVIAAWHAYLEISKNNVTLPKALKDEIDAVTEEKIRRHEAGQSFEDLNARSDILSEQIKAHYRQGSEELNEFVEKNSDLNALMGAILNHCNRDVGRLLQTSNLQNLSAALSEGPDPMKIFLDRRQEYDQVIANEFSDLDCDHFTAYIDEVIRRAAAYSE